MNATTIRAVVTRTVVVRVLAAAVAGLFVLGLLAHAWLRAGASGLLDDLLGLFLLDREDSIPTWFATMLLAGAAVLVWVKGRATPDRWTRRRWSGIAVVLMLMSAEEIVGLHERTTEPLRDALGTSGVLRQAWILPAIAAVVGVAVFFAPFVLRLPARLRTCVLLAGAIFVAGAVGIEMIEGSLRSAGHGDAWLELATDVQELLEMAAIVFLVDGLLRSLESATFTANFLGERRSAEGAATEHTARRVTA